MPSNPYVGPRAFQLGEKLYGRDRELRDLLDLLIAERVVLLYSPSGAGKTSLIQAELIPALRAEKFRPLPVTRVSLLPRHLPKGTNRYLLSVLLSLEEHQAEADARVRTPEECVNELAGLTLSDYLDRCRQRAQKGTEEAMEEVLLFDQFEEVLTLDPTDRAAKDEFFMQVGAALRDRQRWALFAMREEYRAALDPFLRLIPTGLSTTFRLDLLEAAAARRAIQQPARAAGIEFTDEAVQKLVDDLRRVRVPHAEGETEEVLGPYVEPVQLQVVCRNLWEKFPPGTTQIGSSQIETVGQVNTALANYYATSVSATVAASGVPEAALRRWIGRHLITESGLRGQVLVEEAESADLSAATLQALRNTYVVRAEQRRGVTWLELAHDRLIKPVQEDNRKWFAAHLSLLQQQAALWEEKGRPEALLLRGAVMLKEAEDWAAEHPADITNLEQNFLTASQKAGLLDRRIRAAAVALILFTVLACGLLVLATYFARSYERQNVKLQKTNEALVEARKSFKELEARQAQQQTELRTAIQQLRNALALQHAQGELEEVEKIAQTLSASNAAAEVVLNAKEDTRSTTTVRYFQKDIDQNKVDQALQSLSLKLEKRQTTEGIEGVPTNCIWYGSQVNIEDVRLVAYTLITAGVRIKAIKPATSQDKALVIQVGGSGEAERNAPLTVEQIRACNKSC